ncbi:TPA: restriction endonuclease subunit S [Vibrio parahaemolyticus]|uniref:restriction endonuclease subunit S n=1 Tax=Vibrio parahaemolyticus TaxID=670 RepID=UPI001E2CCA7F|nr:restriction endonuclease subunit S [Vibrio parahaemolyticus]
MVPNGWEFTTFENHIDLLSGFAFKSAQYTENIDDIRLLRGDNIAPNTLRWDGVKTWDKHQYAELQKYHLREHDFVIAMDRTWVSSGLKVAEVTKNDLPCLLVQRVARIRALPTLEQSLLRQYFSSYRFEQYVKGVQTETAVPHISSKQIKEFSLLLPPLPEQREIAKILSTWDKAITATEKLIETSKQQKKALMQQLLTGKKRLGIESGSYSFQKTRYGDIPQDWEYPSIREICTQFTQKNLDNKELPVLSCSKHLGFVDSLKYFKKKVYSDDTSGYKVIPLNFFGFPSNHIEEGSIGLQRVYDYGIVSPIYVIFQSDRKRVDNEYLFSVLKTEHYRQIFCAATNASVDRRGSLRWKEFSAIHVPLPPLEEQQKIAAVLKAADKEIELLEAKLAHFKQEKKALMQQLLTGKRRVTLE